jgi:spore maturation protein CgeB
MRWLIGHPGPHFSVHDVYTGWVEALRGLGQEVFTYNLGDRLSFYDACLLDTGTTDASGRPGVRKAVGRDQAIELAANGILSAAYQTWPDVVLLVSAFFTPEYHVDMMRGRGHKIVLLHTESPYQDGSQLARAAHADLNLLNDPVNLAAYQAHGPAEYMPHAYRPAIHHPGKPVPDLVCDLAFVGTGYPSRVEFFEAMDLDGLDVLLAGNWTALPPGSPLRGHIAHEDSECLDNEQAAGVYRSAACGLNLYRREAEEGSLGDGWAMGPREVEMAATGLFYLRDPRGEGDEVLPMLPTFTTPGEASEQLRWWLAHPAAREKRAAAAREAVAERTFANNARRLLELLEG